MKKAVFILSLLVVLSMVFVGCFPKPKEPIKLEDGYYLYFSNSEWNFSLIPDWKFVKQDDGTYKLEISGLDLAENVPAPKNAEKVWWWKVVQITGDSSIAYGGFEKNDPSVPMDPDIAKNMDKVVFYFDPSADTTTDHKTIAGVMGDNTKDASTIYFVGSPTGWDFVEMTNGTYIVDTTKISSRTIFGPENPMGFKISLGYDHWDKTDEEKPFFFTQGHYYGVGTGNEYKYFTEGNYVMGAKVTFDPHFSKLTVEPLENISTISSVIDKIDSEGTIEATSVGVVNYKYSTYVFIQDSSRGIEVYKPYNIEDLKVGDLIYVEGSAKKYEDTYEYSLNNSATVTVLKSNIILDPEDITGIEIKDNWNYYGKLVKFKGICKEADDNYGNATFESENATIVVKNYVGKEFVEGIKYTITGVVMYNHDQLKVVPRKTSDIAAPGQIIIDGDLSDWTDYATKTVLDDADDDSKWGESNDINWLGFANDDEYLYIGAKYKASSNGFIVYVSKEGATGGATDMNFGAWPRVIQTQEGTPIHFFIASWEHGDPQLWTVDSTTTKTQHDEYIVSKTNTDPIMEVKIKLSDLGLSKGDKIKFVGTIVGGDNASAPDTTPDNPYPDGWNWNVPLTIVNMQEYTVQ
ncbi:hypothetical protein XO10_06590 [Marinitoga sp. 1135]|uniref:Uncharacterized protein n=1 Tax=Marinitoga piezophila (strain DSM 14283 / JCM 11233 / KA3) TaxID=443254 RepID=H2J3C4_MARPK|nr:MULTISPECIES: hypothetical protein [Marinitoga]AEX85740.1 hypothetical protein Marpi_1337 [Marinitoga piezophila KA3]NUU95945.1 hypothetical protein [Marinitoga sp. 1135]